MSLNIAIGAPKIWLSAQSCTCRYLLHSLSDKGNRSLVIRVYCSENPHASRISFL